MLRKVVFSAVYWAVALFILFTVKKIFDRAYKRRESTSIKFLRSLSEVVIITMAVFFFLAQFEATKEISKTILQSSSLIIALVTFSCQKVLNNVIAGIVLSSSKPFDIGDKITILSGSTPIATGVVIDMTVRHTAIEMVDGRCVLVPNGVIDECSIINNNTLDNNGYPLIMECSFDSDVNLAIQIMEQEIINNPFTINDDDAHRADITCSNINANGFELKGIVWSNTVADNFKACSELRISIYKAWKENNIEIPFHTVTVLGQDTPPGQGAGAV